MKNVKHRTGNIYLIDDWGQYFLAQVDQKKVCLIGLDSANRWANPVSVGNVNNITEAEFSKIIDDAECELLV
jgi:hypothetical protein